MGLTYTQIAELNLALMEGKNIKSTEVQSMPQLIMMESFGGDGKFYKSIYPIIRANFLHSKKSGRILTFNVVQNLPNYDTNGYGPGYFDVACTIKSPYKHKIIKSEFAPLLNKKAREALELGVYWYNNRQNANI